MFMGGIKGHAVGGGGGGCVSGMYVVVRSPIRCIRKGHIGRVSAPELRGVDEQPCGNKGVDKGIISIMYFISCNNIMHVPCVNIVGR